MNYRRFYDTFINLSEGEEGETRKNNLKSLPKKLQKKQFSSVRVPGSFAYRIKK